MRIRVLGSAAGGGLPQWNCACDNCRAARRGEIPARTQSSIAVSADGERWLLVNASPDVRAQVQGFAPDRGRGTSLAAVALTNADIDHTAGLLVLREGGPPPIYATREVEQALREGLGILGALPAYGPVDVRTLVPGEAISFADRDGNALGIEADVLDLSGKPPPYMRPRIGPDEGPGHVIALSLRAGGGGARVLYAPGVGAWSAPLERALEASRLVLFDGTCFTEDELVPLGGKTAKEMGHLAIRGSDGSLARLAKLPNARCLYVHVNNTNPLLRPDSLARADVEARGVAVGDDGMEIEV